MYRLLNICYEKGKKKFLCVSLVSLVYLFANNFLTEIVDIYIFTNIVYVWQLCPIVAIVSTKLTFSQIHPKYVPTEPTPVTILTHYLQQQQIRSSNVY